LLPEALAAAVDRLLALDKFHPVIHRLWEEEEATEIGQADEETELVFRATIILCLQAKLSPIGKPQTGPQPQSSEIMFWSAFKPISPNPQIPNSTQFILYTATDNAVKIGVTIQGETVWLTQKQMAELFGVQLPAINKHLNNIFGAGELEEKAVVSIMETTAADGKTYQTKHYNLDAIISVGYRVNSQQATRFRIWG
jgi:hypothetical protein